jgi:hypothetical protein
VRAHGKIPLAALSPRVGADDSVEEIASELAESSCSRDGDQTWLKAACLRRDDNRCVISHFYDAEEATKFPPMSNIPTIFTEVTPIFPLSLNMYTEAEVTNAATVWEALYRCFPHIRSRDKFSARKINDPCNAMTMELSFHHAFRKFGCALEPIRGAEDTYCFKRYRGFPTALNRDIPQSGEVTLTAAHDPHHLLLLPRKSLLEAHNAVAEILHVTGMGKRIEDVLEEWKNTHCLAPDGTTDIQSLLMVF